MEEKGVPRLLWKTATVEDTHVSHDHAIRAATVRMVNGKTTKRSINNLYPLELTNNEIAAADAAENSKPEKRQPLQEMGRQAERYNFRPQKALPVGRAAVFFLAILALFTLSTAQICDFTSPK